MVVFNSSSEVFIEKCSLNAESSSAHRVQDLSLQL
jgi:hypothetical protein